MKKVIVDTDLKWDDILSICYLMKDPNIEILGITVTGIDETELQYGGLIAKKLMSLDKRTATKVCIGSDVPIKYDETFQRSFSNDMNDMIELLDSLNPKVSIDIDQRPAWDFIYDTLNESDEKVTILSLGGLGNLVKMLQKYSILPTSKIEGIYAMAGTVYSDNNQNKLDEETIYSINHKAEWNIFMDPSAIKELLDTLIPMTLVSINASNQVLFKADYINKIDTKDDVSKLVKLIFECKAMNDHHNEAIPLPVFNPLATLVMTGMINVHAQDAYLDINIDPDNEENNEFANTYFTTSTSRKIKVVQSVSQVDFTNLFINTINK